MKLVFYYYLISLKMYISYHIIYIKIASLQKLMLNKTFQMHYYQPICISME